MNTPAGEGETPNSNPTIEEVVQEIMTRQIQTETFLKAAEEAVSSSEIRNRRQQQQHEEQMKILLQAIEKLTAAAPNNLTSGGNPTGPREWKPPSWDGRTATFRDYFIRMKSSYKTRSDLNPPLPARYYWDTINDSLPQAKRARIRSF